MRRGEIWWAELEDPGPHPVLLLSRDATYRIRSQATVALITSRLRGIPVEVPVGYEEGLAHDSAVNLDNLLTIRLIRLTRKLGTLRPAKLREVETALYFALGLSYSGSGTCSPCSRRSARTARVSTFTRAMASSLVVP